MKKFSLVLKEFVKPAHRFPFLLLSAVVAIKKEKILPFGIFRDCAYVLSDGHRLEPIEFKILKLLYLPLSFAIDFRGISP